MTREEGMAEDWKLLAVGGLGFGLAGPDPLTSLGMCLAWFASLAIICKAIDRG